MADFQHKRGATFSYASPLPDDMDFTGATVSSQVRDQHNTVVATWKRLWWPASSALTSRLPTGWSTVPFR